MLTLDKNGLPRRLVSPKTNKSGGISFDERLDYLAAASFRFFAETATDAELKAAHDAILHGKTADLRRDVSCFSRKRTFPQPE